MTGSRIVRGTKAKFFLYVCGILVITGLIACYNNTLSKLDDATKSKEKCHQQEENLSSQLKLISDHKHDLEKSLKTRIAEHQQIKSALEASLHEEKSKNEKSMNDANLRFSSLQQHYNLLQTEHDDYKGECENTQKNHLTEIDNLKAKMKEIQQLLDKVQNAKENLKSEYLQAQVDKDNLQKQLKTNTESTESHQSEVNHLTKINHELTRELAELRGKCVMAESSSPGGGNEEKPAQESILKSHSSNNQNVIQSPLKSTTASSANVSQGSLNGARPIIMPPATPESLQQISSQKGDKIRLPEGFVPAPKKPEELKKAADETGETPVANNRYSNNNVAAPIKDDSKKVDDLDKDNGANEIFDRNNGAYDVVGFADLNNDEHLKEAGKQHIDNMGVMGNERRNYDDYKDHQNHDPNDFQEQENADDDDLDEYGDRIGEIKDPAVRH